MALKTTQQNIPEKLCEGIFEKGRSGEEALLDFKEAFPVDEQSAVALSAGIAVVCEDCYVKWYGVTPKAVV